MPRLSVIVTAYNIEAYIRQSLEGILAQTLRDIEIIVVDDGSTDATPDIIREYAEKDARIRPILFAENTVGGVATAANAGLDAARGDFIGFADGDDLYEPTMFETLHDAAVANSADLAMCRYQLLDESDGQLKEPAETDQWKPYPRTVARDLDVRIRREMLRFISVPWRKIYRRDLIERAGLRFPVGDFFFEDNPFHWAAILSGQRIVLVPERLCQHRVARAGQTMATADSRLLRIFLHHDIIRDRLRQQGQEDIYGMDLLRWVAGQMSWVSQRAAGDVQRELYDALVPVIGQYDAVTIGKFGEINGPGPTYQMLAALKAADFQGFSRAAGWSGANGRVRRAGSGSPFSGTLLSRGMYHLRQSGIRNTARMTASYIAKKSGIGRNPHARRGGADKSPITNEEIMAALIILQRDMRNLRDELVTLRSGLNAGTGQVRYQSGPESTGAERLD